MKSESEFAEYKVKAEEDLKKVRKEAEREIKLAQVNVLNAQVATQQDISLQLEKQEKRLIESFQGRIKELESNARTAKKSLLLFQNDAMTYSNKEAELIAEIAKHKKDSIQYERNLNTLKTAANTANSNFENTVKELENKLKINDEKSQVEMDELKNKFDHLKNSGEETQARCRSLMDEVKTLQGLLNTVEAADTKINDDVTAAQKMTEEYQNLLKEKVALEENVKSMKNQLMERDEKDVEENEHRLSFVSANATLFEEKELELLSAISEKESALQRCDLLSAEIIELRARTDEAECKYTTNMELSTLNKEINESVRIVATEQIYHEHENVMKERDSLLTRCASLEDQLSTLQYEIDINSSVGEIEGLKDQLFETEKELKTVITTKNTSDEKVQLLEQELMDFKSKKSQSDNEVGKIATAVSEGSFARISHLEEVIIVQKNEISSLQGIVDDLHMKAEDGKEMSKAALGTIESNNNNNSNNNNSNNNELLSEAESTIRMLRDTITSLENDLSSLKETDKGNRELLIVERDSATENNSLLLLLLTSLLLLLLLSIVPNTALDISLPSSAFICKSSTIPCNEDISFFCSPCTFVLHSFK